MTERQDHNLHVCHFLVSCCLFVMIGILAFQNYQQRKLLVTAGNAIVTMQDALIQILNSKPCTESTDVRTY